MGELIIRKVWLKKSSNQKKVTLPMDCDIMPGDYVKIIKIEEGENAETKEKQ